MPQGSNSRSIQTGIQNRAEQLRTRAAHASGESGPAERPKSHLLSPISHSDASQPRPLQPQSPSYLQGRNPYGRILDDIAHPYREPRPTSPSSLLNISAGGQPTSTKALTLNTTPPTQSQREAPSQVPPSSPPVAPKPPAETISFQAAKSFFESKAAINAQGPIFPPSGVVMKGSSKTKEQDSAAPRNQAKNSNDFLAISGHSRAPPALLVSAPEKPSLDLSTSPALGTTSQPVVRRMPLKTTSDLSAISSDSPACRPCSECPSAEVVTEVSVTQLPLVSSKDIASRLPSTVASAETRRVSQSLTGASSVVARREKLNELCYAAGAAIHQSKERRPITRSTESVRRHTAEKVENAAESNATASYTPKRFEKAQRRQSNHNVRGTSSVR